MGTFYIFTIIILIVRLVLLYHKKLIQSILCKIFCKKWRFYFKEVRILNEKKKTADYKIIKDEVGNRYEFYCELSCALVCVSDPVKAKNPDAELMLAWENYGRSHFNQCHKCGKWVTGAMYNPDVLSCVQCTPFEDYPKYCPDCGAKTQDPSNYCHICGARLFYGGEGKNEKKESK